MYIIAKIDNEELLTIKVKRVNSRGSVNDYALTSKDYKYFQFDTHDRPHDYIEEFRERQWFRGYLIGKKKDGKTPIVECEIQVKNLNK